MAWIFFCQFRLPKMIWLPSAQRALAVSRPMPVLAPVITIFLLDISEYNAKIIQQHIDFHPFTNYHVYSIICYLFIISTMEGHLEIDSNCPDHSTSKEKINKNYSQYTFAGIQVEQNSQKGNQSSNKMLKEERLEKLKTQGGDKTYYFPRISQKIHEQYIAKHKNMMPVISDNQTMRSFLPNESKKTVKSKERKFNLQTYKEELIERDKYKNPLKYKIIKEEVGIRNEKRVFEMREDQINRIKEQFMKKKGLQYLRQGNTSVTKPSPKGRMYSPSSKGSQIHQIFNSHKRTRSEKFLKPKGRKSPLKELKDQQQKLGKVVYQKVRKHLEKSQKSSNYFYRVQSQCTVDNALVSYLKVKIKRASMILQK